MIFVLFLASLVTIQAILRHDEARKRRISPQTPNTADSILALMKGVEQHGRGATPAVQTEVAVHKTPAVSNLV
jgi:hypothetical protein